MIPFHSCGDDVETQTTLVKIQVVYFPRIRKHEAVRTNVLDTISKMCFLGTYVREVIAPIISLNFGLSGSGV